jgi:hypothetical protein
LSILLFNLGKILKLDSLTLKHSALHVLDHLLLLLAELLVPELHSVDFFLHCDDLSLTNVGVESILHFPFKLDLSLPEEDLSLSLNDLCENVGFLLLQGGDLALELDAFVFQLLQLLFEFIFNVKVVVSHLGLLSGILIEKIIELIHFKVKVLKGDFK